MKKYFYFAEESRRLRYGDNREIIVGDTHRVGGGVALCENGLHASERVIDALTYAPGPILYLVSLSGEVIHGDNKSAASERKYIAEFDATDLLRAFARKQAMINIHKIEEYCDSNDYDLIVKYLKYGNEELRSAAKSVAGSVVMSMSWLATKLAAKSAAELAVGSAGPMSWSAAWSAARSMSWSAANNMLVEMIKEETGWEI